VFAAILRTPRLETDPFPPSKIIAAVAGVEVFPNVPSATLFHNLQCRDSGKTHIIMCISDRHD
jgi:hypothetical protein